MLDSAAYILCVEEDASLRSSRCTLLEQLGYKVASASPRLAELTLSSRKFDLVVASNLNDYQLDRLINVSDGARVLVLEGIMMPDDFLRLVEQYLRQGWARRA